MTAVAIIGATLALVCLGLLALAALLVLERRRPHPDVATLATSIDRILISIDGLCDRIQAPHLTGLRAQAVEPDANPPAVSIFDDDEYWESREALAERLARTEVNGDG